MRMSSNEVVKTPSCFKRSSTTLTIYRLNFHPDKWEQEKEWHKHLSRITPSHKYIRKCINLVPGTKDIGHSGPTKIIWRKHTKQVFRSSNSDRLTGRLVKKNNKSGGSPQFQTSDVFNYSTFDIIKRHYKTYLPVKMPFQSAIYLLG